MVDDGIAVTEQDMEDLTHNIRLYQDMAKTLSKVDINGTKDSSTEDQPDVE